MNCNRADEYFMKYIDNCLSEAEAAELNKHLSTCEKCKADFAAYDAIVKEFGEITLVEAPEDLEIKVMERIKELPSPKAEVEKGINKLLMGIGVCFAAVLTLGFIIFVNRDIIIETASQYPQLSGYVAVLEPVSDYVEQFTGNLWASVVNLSSVAVTAVDTYKFVILIVALVLVGIQFAIKGRRKDKVEE